MFLFPVGQCHDGGGEEHSSVAVLLFPVGQCHDGGGGDIDNIMWWVVYSIRFAMSISL